MAKSFVHGNGQIAVGLDMHGQVYDLHFPYVGLENHTGGNYMHKIGIWCDGEFSWIDDGSWDTSFEYNHEHEYLTKIKTTNHNLNIKIEFNDVVYNEENIFLREVKIINLRNDARNLKIYFNQQFEIYESYRGDTAFFEPENNVIIHYKGRRMFLINAHNRTDNRAFDDYSIGLLGIEGREGTYKDAEDGELSKNPIEHGLVDSVIGLTLQIEPNQEKIVDYWMCISKIKEDLDSLNRVVIRKTPRYIIDSTNNYWHAWTKKINLDFKDISDKAINLYKRSLHILRVHTDNTGAIIASTDTDLLKYGRDTYSYVWHRDGAFTSIALSRAGYNGAAQSFFDFSRDTITKDGYFMHKYRADKSLGSSWHPWIYKGLKEMPIQLDETALVIYSMWQEFVQSKDIEYFEKQYNPLIKKPIDFIISRINKETGVILPSYGLWEEKFGTSTFTSSTVYGALIAASKFAEYFGKVEKSKEYLEYAKLVKKGMLDYLYDKEKNFFYKLRLTSADGDDVINDTVDSSSLYGLFRFGVLDLEDPKLEGMMEAVSHLSCQTNIGGFPRYQNDNYFKVDGTTAGNPWIITTLWYAQLEIARAKSLEELKALKHYFDWVLSLASDSGVLPEQVNPHTGELLSASPLTWSHAEFVVTILDYLNKYSNLEKSS